MIQRNILFESNQIRSIELYRTFATSSEICSRLCERAILRDAGADYNYVT